MYHYLGSQIITLWSERKWLQGLRKHNLKVYARKDIALNPGAVKKTVLIIWHEDLRKKTYSLIPFSHSDDIGAGCLIIHRIW